MSGNRTTQERDSLLREIARKRYSDPMNTWPQHEQIHERTLMGARLPDSECLRCHLETVAGEQAKAERGGSDSKPA